MIARLTPWRPALPAAAVATVLLLFVLWAGGGLLVQRTGMALAAAVVACGALWAFWLFDDRLRMPLPGIWSIALLGCIGAVAAASVTWSILPGQSTIDANRIFAYAVIFATGAVAARVWLERTEDLLLGILLAASVIGLIAMASRILPAAFEEPVAYARLREPFGYWNAVGAIGMFAVVCAVWLGSARHLPGKLIAAAYPAATLGLIVVLMAQSRGTVLALAVALAVWIGLVPRRLRAAGVIAVAGSAAALLALWVFSQPALATDGAELAARKSAGARLGILLFLTLVLLYVTGILIERWRARNELNFFRRRQLGRALIAGLALLPVLGALALTTTERGLSATVSDATSRLVDTQGTTPGNSPSRLAATSNLRARYWNDAFKVWRDHKWLGTGADTYGAARGPYRRDTLVVRHAHGFIPQSMADWGLIGLIAVLALIATWLATSFRALGAMRIRPTLWIDSDDHDGIALATLFALALAFGTHSFVDWTWYVPGVAIIGLTGAAWLAGSAAPSRLSVYDVDEQAQKPAAHVGVRTARAAYGGAVMLIVAFAVMLPVRADQKVSEGWTLAATGQNQRAATLGDEALSLQSTAVEPYFLISVARHNMGDRKRAEQILQEAVAAQPSNPETWLQLADYRLYSLDQPAGALKALEGLLFLDPLSPSGKELFIQAYARRDAIAAEAGAKKPQRKPGRQTNRGSAGSAPTTGIRAQ